MTLGHRHHATRLLGGLFFAFGVLACNTPSPSGISAPKLADLPPLPAAPDPTVLPRWAERAPVELTFALVGEVRGEIEPCGCPTLPYGGFQRRQRLLDQLRRSESVIHLDAGELLVKGLVTVSGDERVERAHTVLKLSKAVGVQAWSPGPSDVMVLGVAGLRALRTGALEGPPPVSASWVSPNGERLLPAVRVVDAAGVRVAVIGVSAPSEAPELRDQVRVLDPVDAVRQALSDVPPDVDLVVVLGSVADADADRLAREVPEVAALLTTRGIEAEDPRQHDGPGPLIIEASDRGRYLTVVRTRLGAPASAPLVVHPGRDQWKDLRTLRSQAQTIDDTQSRASAQVVLDSRLEMFSEEGRGRNLAYISSIPLAEDLDGEAQVASEIEAFKAETLERAAERAASPPPPLTPTYAASAACVTCHAAEFARWIHSDHARAWESLLRRGATDNPECVGCHTTGFGEPGGFGELTRGNIGRYKAVQCEMCHGPMAGHPDDSRVAPRPITPERCITCHDAANSPDFDFDAYLRRATCQGGSPALLSAPP